MARTHYPQFCALARATEIIGERWTLLIVRDLLHGPKRFSDLLDTLSGITPAMLTTRLANLIDSGVIEKRELRAPARISVYDLTAIGRALRPAIDALILWGGHFLFPMRDDDRFEPDWVVLALEPVAQRARVPALTARLVLRHGGGETPFQIVGGPTGTQILAIDACDADARDTGACDTRARDAAAYDVTVRTSFDVALQFLSGSLPLKKALADGKLTIDGPQKKAALLPSLFNFRHLASRD